MKLKMLGPLVSTIDTRTVRPLEKETEKHYGTAEHKRWAADVKRRANGMCQGRDHQGERKAERGIADHIVERRDGGSDTDPANGMWLCWSCHTRKTAAMRAERARATP